MPCFSLRKRLSLTACITAFFLLLYVSYAYAGSAKEAPQEVSWHISALMVTYDKKKDLYIAEDEVVITGGNTRLEADYVEFSNRTKDAAAQGNVLFMSGGDTITCNAMQINLATETGRINKGTIFVQEGNYYISGENLRKTGKFTYDAEKGSITTCNGDSPDWKITGRNIKVTVEGYGTAANAMFWARKMPVLYSPYLAVPIKTRRQTGLLLPRLTHSDRKGMEYEQPLFVALSRNTDATLYPHYMSERGLKVAGEFRYALSDKSKGTMILDFLDDRQLGDGSAANKDYSYSSTPDRTNTDRWWFRMKHNQELPDGFSARLDLDIVSDADYLQEFKDGFTGFDATNSAFGSDFGRSLDEYDDTVRKNSLLVSKAWPSYDLNIRGVFYDNVLARQNDTEDTTLQTLPSVTFDALRQQVANSGVYVALNSEVRSFYRKDTTDTLVNGQRADFYPKLYYPIRFKKAFAFEPYIGMRTTAWHTPDFTDIYGSDKDYRTRALLDAGASLSTTFNRVFTLNSDYAEKIRHEIIPKITYGFRPDEDQEDLPYFDDLDRLAERNLITWSLTQVFTAKTLIDNPDGTHTAQYRELAWFKLYQDYDIRYERDDEEAEDHPWQDLRLKYELNPCAHLSSVGKLAFDPYNRHFTEIKVGISVSDNRGDSLYSGYRYETDETDSWVNQVHARLTDALAAYYAVEQDLSYDNTIENKIGFTFTRDCWATGVEFKEDSGDKSIAFMIRLKGIGEFGSR